MVFYFIGNLNGDIRAFEAFAASCLDYLDEGPAIICSAGNFGLGVKDFAKKASACLDGRIPLHLCGGHAGAEGWEKNPPPDKGSRELEKGIFLHAHGNTLVTEDGFTLMFLGSARALPQDFYPAPRGCDYDHLPKDLQMADILDKLETSTPDIVVSHLPPSRFGLDLLSECQKSDPRHRRMEDALVPFIDCVDEKLGRDFFWFSSCINVPGQRFDEDRNGRYISLMPVASSRHFAASLETVETEEPTPELYLSNLMY